MKNIPDKPFRAHLENKLYLADDNPYLNYDDLVEACEQIFGSKKAIPYEEFKKLTQDAYKIEMEDYARLHNFTDAAKVTEYLAYASTQIDQNITRLGKSNRILVIGCGQGRLAEVYVTLAKKLNKSEVVFNDLMDAHIQNTQEKIQRTYNSDGFEADGIKVDYLPGDILTIDISQFDAAFMIWYVSAEFCDPSCVENVQRTRDQIYQRIYQMLVPGGSLIEDIPDPNMAPGFYELANFKTAHILENRGILLGKHRNFLLNNWKSEQKDGFPYQLRYTPLNGSDMREKERAGFIMRKTESSSVPVQSISDKSLAIETIRQTSSIWEAIRLLQELMLKTVKFPDGDEVTQKRRKITLWEKI